MSKLNKDRCYPVIVLCSLFGYSKQSYYQGIERKSINTFKEEIILDMIKEYRSDMARLGGRKLHHLISRRLPADLQIGRDAFFSLLRAHGFLIRRRARCPRTTNSYHHFHKYKNLIVDFVPTGSCQLFVSDITYITARSNAFYYLSLITDAYSRKIVGWSLSDRLDTQAPLEALTMALSEVPATARLIHHSDRGVQYCSNAYVKKLMEAQVAEINISMTENSDPRENAIAERVNGILKTEWINDMTFNSLEEARREIAQVIDVYNNKRPHSSIEMLTPEQAHNKTGKIKRKWKNYYTKNTSRDEKNKENVVDLQNNLTVGG